MIKKYMIPLNEESVMYLQRLYYEMDSMAFVIERLFERHKYDTDIVLFESPTYKEFYKRFEMTRIAYQQAQHEMGIHIKKIISEKEQKEDIVFEWKILDFNIYEAEIIIKE